MAARPDFVHLDGELVPWADAKVHVSSAAFKFGAAVFEGLRGYWNPSDEELYLFRLDEHMDRLEFSQRFMRFDEIVPGKEIARRTVELLKANRFRETVHVMPTVFVEGLGGPVTSGPVGVSIAAYGGIGPGFGESGCSVQVSAWQRISDTSMPARVKCNANYQNGRLAAVQAKADGYDAVIMLNARGKVSEGPGQCFVMIRNGRAVTPSLTNDVLESITRETVLELLATHCGLAVEERDVDRSELMAADEAFFCGTAWEVTPITSIDRLPLGGGTVGPVVRRLQAAYLAVARGDVEDHPEWRTPVYA